MIKRSMFAALVLAALASAPKANAAVVMYELNGSTPAATAVLLASGAGSVTVEISSGAAGDFCNVIDTNTTSGILLGMNCPLGSCKEIATPIVTATNTQTPTNPAFARVFSNGVAIICNAARKVKAWVNQ